MKIGIKKIFVVIIWAGLFVLLYRYNLITTDAIQIKVILESHPAIIVEMFILLSVVRVLFFIPGVVFMVLGGLCFGPLTGFLLSMLSTIISETIVYIIGRYFAVGRIKEYLHKNHSELIQLTDKYGHDFLSLGILCPIAPTDLVCLISSILNLNYKKYLLTVIFANFPMMLLYSYLGSSILDFTSKSGVMVLVIGIVLIYTVVIWLKIKSENKALEL